MKLHKLYQKILIFEIMIKKSQELLTGMAKYNYNTSCQSTGPDRKSR